MQQLDAAPLPCSPMPQPGCQLLQLPQEMLVALLRELHDNPDLDALRATCRALRDETAGLVARLSLCCKLLRLRPYWEREEERVDSSGDVLEVFNRQLDDFTSPAPLLQLEVTCVREDKAGWADTLFRQLLNHQMHAQLARVYDLQLHCNMELSEPDLSAVASACSSLRRLTLTAATLNSTALLPLAALRHLRFLHLDNADLRPRGGLRALASLRALVSITLTHLKPFNLGVAQWAVHDDDFVAIADGCPHLESVALNSATVSNTCLKSLSTVQQLRALRLFKVYVCGDEAPNGIGCLSRLTQLTSLTVADCKFKLSSENAILVVHQEFTASIASACKHLASLELANVSLRSASLPVLASMPMLRTLCLRSIVFQEESVDHGISSISLLVQLTSLRADSWCINLHAPGAATPEARSPPSACDAYTHRLLPHVSGLTNLQSLTLCGQGGSNVGLAHLAQAVSTLAQLTTLRLALGCRVRAASLPTSTDGHQPLLGLTRLVHLALPCTAVTEQQVQAALAVMPCLCDLDLGQLHLATGLSWLPGRVRRLSLHTCPSLQELATLWECGALRLHQVAADQATHKYRAPPLHWRLAQDAYTSDPEAVLGELERAVLQLASAWRGDKVKLSLSWDRERTDKASVRRSQGIPAARLEAALAPLQRLQQKPQLTVRFPTCAV